MKKSIVHAQSRLRNPAITLRSSSPDYVPTRRRQAVGGVD